MMVLKISVYVVAALFWFGAAFGLLSYDPWVVTIAFCIVAVDMLLAAGKVYYKHQSKNARMMRP